jgi:hypothetical protein
VRATPDVAALIRATNLIVIASEAKQFILPLRGAMDCFAALAMTVDIPSPSRGAMRPKFFISFAL